MKDYFGPARGRSGNYGTLEFEPGLLTRVGRVRSSRRRSSRAPLWFAAALMAVAALGVFAWMYGARDDRAVAEMAVAAFQWVRDGQIDPSLVSPGRPAFDLGALLGGSTVSAEANAEPGSALRQAVLAKIRKDVEAGGGRWSDAKALAFGGVRARVLNPGSEAATAVTGNIYFAVGNRVYALEVSAERLDDRYIPTDFWQCAPLSCDATQTDAMEAHSQQCYEAFLNETPVREAGAAEPQIDDSELVFITF